MDIKRMVRVLSIILIMVVLATSLTACLRQASEGPEGTSDESYPVPGDTQQPSTVDQAATATAQASGQTGSGDTGGTSGGDTNQPAVTETPAPAPTATTAPAYVQPTAGIPTSHTLKYGEFPFCIARRFNVNQYELLALNGLGLNSPTYVGMTLSIPQTGNHFDGNPALKSHPAQYTVQSGDTLEVIACKFGNVSPDMIALQNNLQSPYTLAVGQVLVIP